MQLKSTEEEYICVLNNDLSYSFIEFITRQDVFYQDNQITTFSSKNNIWLGIQPSNFHSCKIHIKFESKYLGVQKCLKNSDYSIIYC